MRSNASVLLILLLTTVSACSGGGSGSSGSSASTPPTQPTPVPSPTPAPASGPAYRVELVSPAMASIDFYPGGTVGSGLPSLRADTNEDGIYDVPRIPGVSSPNLDPVNAIGASGVDAATRTYAVLRAPVGATVISPITSLIYDARSGSIVRTVLGMNTPGPFQVSASVDLLTYSAIANRDRRLIASNARVLLLYMLQTIDQPQTLAYQGTQAEGLGQFIRANPSLALFTQEGMEQLLRASAGRLFFKPSDAAYRAAARLANDFAHAAGPLIEADPAKAANYVLALHGYLWPELRRVLEESTPAAIARADAIGSDFTAIFALFDDGLYFPVSLFAPGPDYVLIPHDGEVLLFAAPKDSLSLSYAPDIAFRSPNVFGASAPSETILAVSVPNAYREQVEAELLPDRTIRIRARIGFRGVARVHYQAQVPDGRTEIGQIWVYVK